MATSHIERRTTVDRRSEVDRRDMTVLWAVFALMILSVLAYFAYAAYFNVDRTMTMPSPMVENRDLNTNRVTAN